MSDDDVKRGLYGKFHVARADGSSGPGGKHEHCNHFVLDIEHDPFAIPALRAYADACEPQYPALARDVLQIIEHRSAAADASRTLPDHGAPPSQNAEPRERRRG